MNQLQQDEPNSMNSERSVMNNVQTISRSNPTNLISKCWVIGLIVAVLSLITLYTIYNNIKVEITSSSQLINEVNVHQMSKHYNDSKAQTAITIDQPNQVRKEEENYQLKQKNKDLMISEKQTNIISYQLNSISEYRVQKEGNIKINNRYQSQIKFQKQKWQNKKIQQILYQDPVMLEKRLAIKKQRIILSNNTNFQSLKLIQYNFIENQQDESQKKNEDQEYSRVNQLHQLQQYQEQLPICIIIPSYNNNANFRIQYNLNSVFTQNYSNYFAVIINDASTDGSDSIYRKYLYFNGIASDHFVYILNSKRLTALQNIYIAVTKYCSNDALVMVIDGDDELIGKNVLKIFNVEFQRLKAGVVYSNFIYLDHRNKLIGDGFTQDYTDQQKQNNLYRQSQQKFSQLRVFRSYLFSKIKLQDLQDQTGIFFKISYDMILYFPLMELSCKRVYKISGMHYLYHINTGLNDYSMDPQRQTNISKIARNKNKYNCDQQFESKMNKK